MAEKALTHGLAISAITEMELIVGCRDRSPLRAVNRLINRFEAIDLDWMISRQTIELLQQYRLSHGLLIPDAIIAATALSQKLPLLTRNQRDYRFIDQLELLG